MNVVDLIIIGAVGLVALMGLKSGILKPASGIGGFILGIMLAFQHHSEVAVLYAQYIDGAVLQRVAGFATVVIATAVAARVVAWLVKKALSGLFLGWVDNVAGAVGGATVGILVTGTILGVMGGINISTTQDVLDSSALAPQVSQASLIAPSTPWCAALAEGGQTQGCTDMKGMVKQFFGMDVDEKMNEMLGGQDAGAIVEIVKGSLNGTPPEELVKIANATDE